MPGIGAKTAAALLAHFGSLDAVLARIDEVPYLRSIRGAAGIAVKLRAHRDLALMSRRLATIALDAPFDTHRIPFLRAPASRDALIALCESLRFGPMTRRRLGQVAGLDLMASLSAS